MNVDQKLIPNRVRTCFKTKKPLLISKYWLLVLSKSKKSGSSLEVYFYINKGHANFMHR